MVPYRWPFSHILDHGNGPSARILSIDVSKLFAKQQSLASAGCFALWIFKALGCAVANAY